MKNYLKLQYIRALNQKALWIYLIAFFLLQIGDCMTFIQNPEDEFSLVYSGGKFAIFILQRQMVMVGPLFFALLAAFSINSEKSTGMIKQPLLYGITKPQFLNCKILNQIIVMIQSVFLLEILGYIIGYFIWGNKIFDDFTNSILHIFLSLIPMSVSCIGFLLVALYTPNIAVTMCTIFIILLADNVFSQFFASIVSKFSYLYYAYAFSSYNGIILEKWMIFRGLLLSIITGLIFYVLANRRVKRMLY